MISAESAGGWETAAPDGGRVRFEPVTTGRVDFPHLDPHGFLVIGATHRVDAKP
jgi:hypothetical protein